MQDTVGDILPKSNSSFEWRILDFFALSGEEDDTYTSPEFEFEKDTFCLLIWPHGSGMCLYLNRRDCKEKHLRFTASIKDTDGVTCICRSVKGTERDLGWEHYMNRSELDREKYVLVQNRVLTIFFTISSITSGEQQKLVPRGNDKLSQDFENLFHSEDITDVTLKVKGKVFRAHKAILVARSPVFRSMFKHDTIERNSDMVDITDCDPDVFSYFLFYLYSGNVDKISGSNVLGLYKVADKYDAEEFKAECVNFMIKRMSADNFCDVYYLALQHDDLELLEFAKVYFETHTKKIIVTAQWVAFLQENPVAANKLHIKMIDKINQSKLRNNSFSMTKTEDLG